MTPRLTVTSTNASLAGLENDRQYYFAVVTVNLSDGFDPAVTTVSATPRPDTQGPEVTEVQFDGAPLTNGLVIRRPGRISLQARDRAGVSRVEFRVDGTKIYTDVNGGPSFGCLWNVTTVSDGVHVIRWDAYDTLDNDTFFSNDSHGDSGRPDIRPHDRVAGQWSLCESTVYQNLRYTPIVTRKGLSYMITARRPARPWP